MTVVHPCTGNSMFDCPEHSHTSPETMFSRVIESLPSSMVMLHGPPASGVGSPIEKLPSRPASAASGFSSHPACTVTLLPGDACPSRVMTLLRCTIILSDMYPGRVTAAEAGSHAIADTIYTVKSLFMETVVLRFAVGRETAGRGLPGFPTTKLAINGGLKNEKTDQ